MHALQGMSLSTCTSEVVATLTGQMVTIDRVLGLQSLWLFLRSLKALPGAGCPLGGHDGRDLCGLPFQVGLAFCRL